MSAFLGYLLKALWCWAFGGHDYVELPHLKMTARWDCKKCGWMKRVYDPPREQL